MIVPTPKPGRTSFRRVAIAICWAIALPFVSAAPLRAVAADLVGQASVVDGDTIEVHGVRIRLHGIDAPESGQVCFADGVQWRCGQQAALALDARIAGRTVSCSERDVDRYGRVVAVCSAGGEDLNAWLVAEGWALAYRRYSLDYVDEEAAAAAARRGIWRGEFVAPWDWRQGARVEDSAVTPGNCAIKGNINREGERIYHVPGGMFYERTRIDSTRGERWFCSEGEAIAAGWRRSQQ